MPKVSCCGPDIVDIYTSWKLNAECTPESNEAHITCKKKS